MLGTVISTVLGFADRLITKSKTHRTFEEEVADPYPSYKLARVYGNVLRSYQNRGWLVLGFEEAQSLFLDRRFGSDLRKNRFLSNMMRLAANGRPVPFLDNPTMLNRDPPDHTRLRKLASQGFLHKYILSLEPGIAQTVEECLDSYDATSGRFDIVKQLAEPLPALVIGRMMGLPDEDLPRFKELSTELLGLTAIGNDELMDQGIAANGQLLEYFEELIRFKRKNPGQDIVSRLIEAEEEGDRLSLEELYSTCVLLLVAGHETTTRLIGNGMYLLLKHPDQMEILKREPELMPNAIEEMLRYEPPVQLMPRFALEDCEFYGRKIRKNQLIAPIIASANRDPVANPDPDVFDVTREEIKHVSFGHGIHLCLGLNLARLEGRVAINALLSRFPAMTMAEQALSWTPIPLVRGLDNLVIETNEASEEAVAAS